MIYGFPSLICNVAYNANNTGGQAALTSEMLEQYLLEKSHGVRGQYLSGESPYPHFTLKQSISIYYLFVITYDRFN